MTSALAAITMLPVIRPVTTIAADRVSIRGTSCAQLVPKLPNIAIAYPNAVKKIFYFLKIINIIYVYE